MDKEIIIILAIVILAGISIILAIINWVNLSFTSSKILKLEEAIEKKTKEFDTLKKERQPPLSHIAAASEAVPVPAPLPSSYNAETISPPIEIVRNNARTGFQTVDIERIKNTETLDVADHDFIGEERNPFADGVMEIPLFSDIKKDTDFTDAWKTLTAYLAGTGRPNVAINFNNVLFLYEKELHYLEKMCEVVAKAGGSLKFINYHSELRPILSAHGVFSRHLREEHTAP